MPAYISCSFWSTAWHWHGSANHPSDPSWDTHLPVPTASSQLQWGEGLNQWACDWHSNCEPLPHRSNSRDNVWTEMEWEVLAGAEDHPLCPPLASEFGITINIIRIIRIFCLLLLLSHFSRVRLCATPETAAHQAAPSLGFSRQEHWSGLPFPSPMHESDKWKWSPKCLCQALW